VPRSESTLRHQNTRRNNE